MDKGYTGHKTPTPMSIFRSVQNHLVHGQIRQEGQRRSAIEPVIGHCMENGHLDCNHPKGRNCDQINDVMSAVG